ncbi:glycerophosphodiester phosphodiesterase family protein [Herbidospora cretacea]|uniref:glycerophosphodiester phosphodiesterase family protein n=1 Tax=Herbidospora cretacea TaxID=28444 RepID=UPI00077368E4|nr:glycerophosphodiester phosphodiesterase family protein [Herbidospora cretacea]
MHRPVELHGHRGARGLRPENTLPGLAYALEIGVDALEFDVVLTADQQLVLSHDLTVSPITSRDTGGEQLVGRPINQLTLSQLRTLDVGVRRPVRDNDPFMLTQVGRPDTRMPTLGAVLGLVSAYGADHVRLNVELKSDPTRPDLSADPKLFTNLVLDELARHRRIDNSAVLSFDWRVLAAARDAVPNRYALVEAATIDPVWMAGFDIRDFEVDIAGAAEAVGATVLSPDRVLVDKHLMTGAARRGLPVVVWTVNDVAEAAELLDLGVAAIVTDYPDRMRELWATRGIPLPRSVKAVAAV